MCKANDNIDSCIYVDEATPRAGDSAKKRRLTEEEALALSKAEHSQAPDSPYIGDDLDDLGEELFSLKTLSSSLPPPLSPVRRRSKGSVTVAEPHDLAASLRVEEGEVVAMAEGARREFRVAKRPSSARHPHHSPPPSPRPPRQRGRVVGPADAPCKYELQGLLGEGGAAQVWSALEAETQRWVAIKVVPMHKTTGHEGAALRACEGHPHVVSLLEEWQQGGKLYLCTELAQHDLLHRLQHSGPFSEAKARSLCEGLLEALAAMHRGGYSHRDVKLENLLLAAGCGRLLLADFGSAAPLVTPAGGVVRHRDAVGSKSYMPPEVASAVELGYGDYSGAAADVWTTGIVLYAMTAGEFPFESAAPSCMGYQRFLQNEHPWPAHFSAGLINLLQSMLASVSQRVSIAEVQAHSWFSEQNI